MARHTFLAVLFWRHLFEPQVQPVCCCCGVARFWVLAQARPARLREAHAPASLWPGVSARVCACGAPLRFNGSMRADEKRTRTR